MPYYVSSTKEAIVKAEDIAWIKQGYMNGIEYIRSGIRESYEKIFDDFIQQILSNQKIVEAVKENLDDVRNKLKQEYSLTYSTLEIILQSILQAGGK